MHCCSIPGERGGAVHSDILMNNISGIGLVELIILLLFLHWKSTVVLVLDVYANILLQADLIILTTVKVPVSLGAKSHYIMYTILYFHTAQQIIESDIMIYINRSITSTGYWTAKARYLSYFGRAGEKGGDCTCYLKRNSQTKA